MLIAATVVLQTQFRTAVDAVAVDVSVMSGSRPVGGLAAADFVLTDNGVRQQVAIVTTDAPPLDITLITGAHQYTDSSFDRYLQRATAAALQVAALVRPPDRVRMLKSSGPWHEIVDVGPSFDRGRALERVPFGSAKAAEYLAMAMMRPQPAGWRHLIVLFKVGFSAHSEAIGVDRLAEIAKRFDGVVHVVRFAHGDDDYAAAARATGGDFHAVDSPDDAEEIFERIFDRFRRSYVLRYVSQGVAREGWHAIDVKVTRPAGSRYTVRARNGYYVD